ncbi:MAG: hypothetical protein HFF44_03755 [Lawsonibacter sp.]|nr:hypothetical protein [Lawsonibacter sp.]
MSSVLLFASDAPLEECPYPPDFSVHYNIDCGTVDDGSADDGFAILPVEKVLELQSEKEYFAVLEWRCTQGRAEKVIEYLKSHLKTTHEVEFWHVWQDMDFDHRLRKIEIPLCGLTAEDIQELDQLEVWKEPVVDYCYVITRGECV